MRAGLWYCQNYPDHGPWDTPCKHWPLLLTEGIHFLIFSLLPRPERRIRVNSLNLYLRANRAGINRKT
jgi:hypothetical protein